MKSSYEYRMQARELIQHRWREIIIVSGIIMLSTIILTMLPNINVLKKFTLSTSLWITVGYLIINFLPLLIVPIRHSLYTAILNKNRGSEENILHLTWQQIETHYLRFLVASIITIIVTLFVGLFTLGIGAIILSYAYRMVPYLLSDYPQISASQAVKISREMMKGYKFKLFILDLSFIGWILVCILTFGLATLVVAPWINAASGLFYDDLKAKTIVESED